MHTRLLERLKASGKLFADETTAPVLDPGRGLGLCARPQGRARRTAAHLAGFTGVLQVDGYAGYRPLAEKGDIRLAFCWAHVRRRFYELAAAGPAPIRRAISPTS